MTVSLKEALSLATCLVALAALWLVYERIPVMHLKENPYVTCINDAAKSPELKKLDVPISAACPGF
jgi:hypothetical protein